jgi:hypothetical protein
MNNGEIMLLQIRDYIAREKLVSEQQLMREFHLAPEALDPMLSIWLKKNIIQKIAEESTACQSACFKCTPNKPNYYRSLMGQ